MAYPDCRRTWPGSRTACSVQGLDLRQVARLLRFRYAPTLTSEAFRRRDSRRSCAASTAQQTHRQVPTAHIFPASPDGDTHVKRLPAPAETGQEERYEESGESPRWDPHLSVGRRMAERRVSHGPDNSAALAPGRLAERGNSTVVIGQPSPGPEPEKYVFPIRPGCELAAVLEGANLNWYTTSIPGHGRYTFIGTSAEICRRW